VIDPTQPATVDKAALGTAITEADKLVEADYSAGWADFQTALTAAKAANSKVDATQAEVDKAVEDLDTATKALVKKPEVPAVDKDSLNAKIQEAEGLTEAQFTAASWADLQTALTAANEVKVKTDATQTEVDEALAALAKAIQDLETV